MKDQIYIIAEIGQAHEGSLGIAHSYIDALAETCVNAVKFQVHIAEAESSPFELFRVPFSYEDQTRYDYWKRMEFNLEQWEGLKRHCEEKFCDIAKTVGWSLLYCANVFDISKHGVDRANTANPVKMSFMDRILHYGRKYYLNNQRKIDKGKKSKYYLYIMN